MHFNPRTPHLCSCPARLGCSQPGRHSPVLTGNNLIFFIAPNIWNPAGVCRKLPVSAAGSQGIWLGPAFLGVSGKYSQAAKHLWKVQSWQELCSCLGNIKLWNHTGHFCLSYLPGSIRSRPPSYPGELLGARGDLHKIHTLASYFATAPVHVLLE